jgi:hypothetical protein
MVRGRRDLIVRALFMIILSLSIRRVSSQEACKLFLVTREALTNLIILLTKHSQPVTQTKWIS